MYEGLATWSILESICNQHTACLQLPVHCIGPIAQRLEPPAHNRPVPGSNPGGPSFFAGIEDCRFQISDFPDDWLKRSHERAARPQLMSPGAQAPGLFLFLPRPR